MKTLVISKPKRRSSFGGWTKARRAAAAARCRLHKPSRFSTGPKTRAGKVAVRLNALKHGATSAHWRLLAYSLRQYKKFIKEVRCLQYERNGSTIIHTRMNWQGNSSVFYLP